MVKTQASLGWLGPDAEDIIITNRAGASVAVGAVLQLDRRRADGDSTNNTVGSANAGIANGIVIGAATTDQMVTEVFGVVQQAVADNVKCRFRLRGYCDAVSFITANVVLATSRCFPTPAGTSVTVSNAAQENTGTAAALARKIPFLPLTAGTAPSTTDGWWDGINGFGTILLT